MESLLCYFSSASVHCWWIADRFQSQECMHGLFRSRFHLKFAKRSVKRDFNRKCLNEKGFKRFVRSKYWALLNAQKSVKLSRQQSEMKLFHENTAKGLKFQINMFTSKAAKIFATFLFRNIILMLMA